MLKSLINSLVFWIANNIHSLFLLWGRAGIWPTRWRAMPYKSLEILWRGDKREASWLFSRVNLHFFKGRGCCWCVEWGPARWDQIIIFWVLRCWVSFRWERVWFLYWPRWGRWGCRASFCWGLWWWVSLFGFACWFFRALSATCLSRPFWCFDLDRSDSWLLFAGPATARCNLLPTFKLF